MDIYSDFEDVIEEWSRNHSLKWIKEFGGEPRRFLYLSNQVGESYQLSLDFAPDGGLEVNLYSVERFEKDDIRRRWSATRESLADILDSAVVKVEDLASHP